MCDMPSNTSSLAEGGSRGCFFISKEESATPSIHSAFLPWLLWPRKSHHRWIIHTQIKGDSMNCLVFSTLLDMNHCHVLSCGCPSVALAAPRMNSWAQLALKLTERGQMKFPGPTQAPGSEQNQIFVSTLGAHWFWLGGLKLTSLQGRGRCGKLAKWATSEMLWSERDPDGIFRHPTPPGQLWLSSGGRGRAEGGPVARFKLCWENSEDWFL